MFKIESKVIHITRGDAGTIKVTATDDNGTHTFSVGDKIRLNVMEANNVKKLVLQKDVTVATQSTEVSVALTSTDTKIGKTINKPDTYWCEIVLNPTTSPQTIIGYDEDGPKRFILYPEGEDVNA